MAKKTAQAAPEVVVVKAPTSIGSATISFGLVSVPVKLYTGTSSHDLAFNQLHAKCTTNAAGARIKTQSLCSTCGEVVTATDLVKGHEFSKGQYAVFTAEELKAFEEATDNSVEIQEFVPLASVDPTYFEKATFLGPQPGAQKAYRLLTAAMAKSQQAAVAKFSTRGRDKMVLLRASAGGLMMHTLYYTDEVRTFAALDLGESVEVKDTELDLALLLIDNLAIESFDPTTYTDAYCARILVAVDEKKDGKAVTLPTAPVAHAAVVDVMAALRASLGQPKKTRKAA